MRGRIFAWANLAFRFALHLLQVPLRPLRRGRGLARLLDTIAPEGYLPLAAADRDELPRFMTCMSCGLCALASSALRAAPASAWHEPWTFVIGASRSLERAPLVRSGIPPAAREQAVARVCPMGVPIPALAGLADRLMSPKAAGSRHGSA